MGPPNLLALDVSILNVAILNVSILEASILSMPAQLSTAWVVRELVLPRRPSGIH